MNALRAATRSRFAQAAPGSLACGAHTAPAHPATNPYRAPSESRRTGLERHGFVASEFSDDEVVSLVGASPRPGSLAQVVAALLRGAPYVVSSDAGDPASGPVPST